MFIIEDPFKRVAVYLVGPIQPATTKGNRYFLTVVNFCYSLSVALNGIETEMVANALEDIFCRRGLPMDVITDIGSQFTLKLSRLLYMRQLPTKPYHPMYNEQCAQAH